MRNQFHTLCFVLVVSVALSTQAEDIYPWDPGGSVSESDAACDVALLDARGVQGTLDGSATVEDGSLQVSGQQVLIKPPDNRPILLQAPSMLSWAWQKKQGKVCIVQLAVTNPDTGQVRYFGYGAGAWSEPPSPDPTVEVFVSTELPRERTTVERHVYQDIQAALGWSHVEVTGVYLSPWDGQAGSFADVKFSHVIPARTEERKSEPTLAAQTGTYIPQRLKRTDEKHVDRFETSFEECMPGRNSAANEWSAFGIDGDRDFNAIGREMHVRYPAFDVVFRLLDGDAERAPGELESFRLGLVDNHLPAIWGAWVYDKLRYRVTAMTTPGGDLGNYDLYKLQVQNPTQAPAPSKLAAIVEGPPDMHIVDDVVVGLGAAPFMLAQPPGGGHLTFRDWGLCDKRTKSCDQGGVDGAEAAIATCRVGLDGVPVLYRFKADADKHYVVCLASSPHISGYWLEKPTNANDLIYEYRVEGCEPVKLDYVTYLRDGVRPLFAAFNDARDTNGDGYVDVSAGVADESRVRQTRLGAIYVFPAGTPVEEPARVYSGEMNARCVWHIDVGVTPEQGPANQQYDKTDIGFARLKLGYDSPIAPGETKTYWLKVPSVHRREPVSMGYIAHAFREALPGEAVPPFGPEKVAALKSVDPVKAEAKVAEYWKPFFARATEISTPDTVLTDIFLSRLATRAILDVKIDEGVYYNPCSPFFYFDHAYRDQAYVVRAYDLAGLHDRAERLLSAYCRDTTSIQRKGPISFDGRPLQLGMLDNGLWQTRPGQFDTQGENIWALVQHYKLTGDRAWLESTAYPFIRRGALWIVSSRHKHMDEVKDAGDPRYGLIEPGAMEVMDVGHGVHMYYLNAFAVLGLSEAADAARGLDITEDATLFSRECDELRETLHNSFAQTFKRTGLYEGYLWFGVEPEGVGMYGFWAHNALLWPCRCLEPQDPMLTATFRRMERMSNEWGGGMHSEGAGSYWPYIGADRAVGHILRDEPDKALDYFCAFTDTAGGTFSWGEGYSNLTAMGDEPHFWADAQWINLFRHLFATEDGNTLMITPATLRRWTAAREPIRVRGLPTTFGALDLTIEPHPDSRTVAYGIRLTPKGDQQKRNLEKILLYPRIANGARLERVEIDGQESKNFSNDVVVIPGPVRGREWHVAVSTKR